MKFRKSKEDLREVEVWEFSLTGEEIDELIEKLNVLKQLKTQVSYDLDDEHEFLISYINQEVEPEKDDEPMGIRG